MSRGHWRVLEESVEAAGEVALEAAVCFSPCLAFLDSPFDVGDRGGVPAASVDEDHVDRAVEAAVAASVEAVPDGLARGGRDRRDAGEAGERGFVGDAARV